ncbi:transketolase [Patescibacteria group bacterium]|nr:transketolase [Patescibacteria group bacterium]
MPTKNKKATKINTEDLYKISNKLKQTVIDMLLESGTGHTAGSLGTAEIFSALYFEILNIDPKKPNKKDRDRFLLSNGHICPIWYATLSERGFFPKTELWKLRKINSKLQGHPKINTLPGIENSSGSLGQGLSQAIGIALAAKMDGLSYRVYCMTGDGELNEGQIWEAAMFAPNKKLNNITWIIDRNNIQSDGNTEDIMPLENLKDKLESFNWYVIEIDGHNIEEIISACKMAKSITQRPTVIIAHTIPGEGVDFMENKYQWHGRVPTKKEAVEAKEKLNSII